MVTPAQPAWGSLLEVVRHHAGMRPEHCALVFLPDGEREGGRLSYAELDRRARVFGAQVQRMNLQGTSLLLMLPPGMGYIVAFLGCLYAGAIPVPGYPPTNSMHAERMAHIVEDCQARAVIVAATSKPDPASERMKQHLPAGLGCRFIPIDDGADLGMADPVDWHDPAADRDGTAYLQYTSGSTSHPRGVVVTHGNLLSNCATYARAAALDEADVFVTWLPLFHDMGLIWGVIQALYVGATIVMMPPLCFVQKPLRWLQAISRYRGTISCAPNFAYELCASAEDQALRGTLDLSSWCVAGNAAEPVHPDTLARFARRFGPCGFRPAAMNPSYGLAEATLAVTSHPRLRAPRVIDVDRAALSGGRLAPAPNPESAHQLVSCGRAWLDTRLAIVDELTREMCVDGRVGEIWVQGPQVAQGYWRRDTETAETFGACLAEGGGPWLRTGDLGVLQDGELYITGRLKDVIIIRGQNHYPQDIEHTMYRAHAALEIGHGAAFPVEVDGQERLVVVQEVRRSQRHKIDGAQVVQAIRAAIAEVHGLQVHAVQLLRPASVHITSSGKIQRRACKQSYLTGQFEVLHAWQEAPAGTGAAPAAEPVHRPPMQEVVCWLQRHVAATQPQPSLGGVDVRQSFSALGLDSLKLAALSADLGRWLGTPIDPVTLYSHSTIEALARHVTGGGPASAAAMPRGQAEPIAVIGLACRFPGATSADDYWRLLDQGRDAITGIPASRWPGDAHGPAEPPTPRKASTKWGGFLEDIDCFDAHFFGISPREAAGMDPQQRLLLQTSWHALEDAGIAPDALAGSDTGVFIGAMTHDYELLQLKRHAPLDAYFATGTDASILAHRISYLFDLRGPSWVTQTACSSSLVALHSARLSLQAGECGVALVGGVNCLLAPELFAALSQAQMLSPDGRCMTFDARANGYVRSEGCAVLVLKRLADALRDNDRVYGVIRGTAVNQDGRSNGLTAPSGEAQQAVIRQALAVAGMDAFEVSYVEAHGTGTSLGDPIEVDALKQTYGRPSHLHPTLWIGAVKSQIGHTEPVSGLAGLTKVLLALQHDRLPANLHFKALNPHIELQGTRCAVLARPQAWVRGAAARVAAVSSFGFGGANAHVIVAEAPVAADRAATDEATASPGAPTGQLLTVSAKTPAALQRRAAQLAALLEQDAALSDPAAFHALCHTANAHRAHLKHRLAVVAHSAREAAVALHEQAQQAAPRHLPTAVSAPPAHGRLAMLFTGQGAQYAGMGATLYRNHQLFRRGMDRCDELLQPLLQGRSLVQGLYGSESQRLDLGQTAFAQPALFAIGHSLAAVWRAAGLQPGCLIGHSLGEYVAACLAGVFSLQDALTLVAHRGRLMQQRTPRGAMVALHGDERTVQCCVDELGAASPGDAAIAARNTPADAVISGDPDAVAAWVMRWQAACPPGQLQATPLQVERAFHSPLMTGMLEEFAAVARRIGYHAPRIDIISNVTGELIGEQMADPAYWVEHVMRPVEFFRGMQALSRSGCTAFVEVGPHPVLTAFGQQGIEGGTWLTSLRRGADDERQLLDNLGQWHVSGGTVDWRAWSQARFGATHAAPRPVSLPPYPFQPDRHWFKAGAPAPDAGAGEAPTEPQAQADPAERPFELGATLLALPLDEARNHILGYLLRLAGRTLKLDAVARSRIERDFVQTPLNQLGFDSLMAVEVRNRIRGDSGADVPLKHFLAGSTAAEVAELILAQVVVRQMATAAAAAEPHDGEVDPDMETITL
jgi:phthiocerol/phenolphthiocerol synthesis type-I polyketide synthase C